MGANWKCVQLQNDFPSSKEGQITGTGWRLSQPGLNLSPDSSVTVGNVLQLTESPLSYSQARIIKVPPWRVTVHRVQLMVSIQSLSAILMVIVIAIKAWHIANLLR